MGELGEHHKKRRKKWEGKRRVRKRGKDGERIGEEIAEEIVSGELGKREEAKRGESRALA